ncbi:hypothetical protein MP228_000944 [Amoeboaphelidium protococcarum]|nr:hypothetical protein MP228_000944 [Amoeboaphelidium protococcarum]
MAKLFFYYSSMNAGKTTTLLQSSFNYNERGMKTLLFAPVIDDRYGVGKITSRIGLQQEAIAFEINFNFYQFVQDADAQTNDRYSCILVDEAQFLTKDQVLQLSDIVDILGIPVLCYGLRSDFRGEPFEGSAYLLSIADTLSEIKTICHCGRKATFNARVTIDENGEEKMVLTGDQILCGGNSVYKSLCRRHWKLQQLHNDAK